MIKKRDRLGVIYDILNTIKENKNSIKPTPLLRCSNLSSKRFYQYIKELIEKKFVREIKDKYGKKVYTLGDRGFRFLDGYNTIREFINDFDL